MYCMQYHSAAADRLLSAGLNPSPCFKLVQEDSQRSVAVLEQLLSYKDEMVAALSKHDQVGGEARQRHVTSGHNIRQPAEHMMER